MMREGPDRRLALWTGVAVAIACTAVVIARVRWALPLGREVGMEISHIGLSIQLAVMVAGIVLLNLTRAPIARWVLVVEGMICLLAWGIPGIAFVVGLLAWWVAIGARGLGRARIVLVIGLVGAVNACAWGSGELAASGLVFSLMFSMRLFVFAYDRWQHDFEPVPLIDFLAFLLPAPLVIVPPYFTIIPLFGGSRTQLRTGLTVPRLIAIGRHLALAALFGGMRAALALSGLHDQVGQPAAMYVGFAGFVLELAALAHLLIPLLLLHGIEERLPIDRPLLATRFVELWQRYGVHLKDAQVFLFYTPALLRLRRLNRYLAITLATAWTLIVGNTLLHVAIRYCFVADPWGRIGGALIANTLMAIALAIDLCHAEWSSRRSAGPAPRSVPRLIAGWLFTMTLAATVATL